ncbi:FkbM family methyltransferase [Adhaeribacter swui]|uniref:FkbM family methyltransferase n=1 Tax=Adhaeribacter swui TaxID=2086471 RepID=A0A7G7G9A5_9BACT|nr:FkbM family methyltransferase [Adhaeribacter swui]QNF33739.1 FkbM family methyltransferase [Adhaeribacter swui]
MLLAQLQKVEEIATSSKVSRLLAHPYRYLKAIGYRQFLYPFLKKGWRVQAQTFWQEPFWVDLPAGTDIYLTGGKADESEIRLARYLIKTLKPYDTFIDVGSHFGYFSRLALQILKNTGSVVAVEPSKKTFALLQKNLAGYSRAIAVHCLIGAENSQKTFYEFPVNYSEYNTAFPEQFAEHGWYKKAAIDKYTLDCKTLDSLVAEHNLKPQIIKIDTEGSEHEVILGAQKLLTGNKTVALVMEYLSKARHNQAHVQATAILKNLGYLPFVINPDSTLTSCPDVEQHLEKTKRESDNIVYRYQN